MDVNVYIDSANDNKFVKMLSDFTIGAKRSGDNIRSVKGDYEKADVHVIFGSWKDRDVLHHNVKRSVVEKAKKFVCIETPLVGRKAVKNVGDDVWYRVGVNGFLADTGNFNNKNRPSDRWHKIKKELNVELKPYQTAGEYILVTLQVPGDASLRGCVIEEWCWEVCHTIRRYTKRPILIRTSQVPKQFNFELLNKLPDRLDNIAFQEGTKENLIPTLEQCWATVTYSSGMGIDSYINGVPSFTMDKGNFAYSLGNTSLKHIESPNLPNREQWLSNLCYAQWSEHEMQEGKVWNHLKEVL